jgi:hypothetical protein
MELRYELMPPALDEAKVRHLAGLAARIDGARPGQWEDELDEFNREAGTALNFVDFQGIYGGQDHDTWVRKVLAEPDCKRLPDITRAELLELIRRAAECHGEEHEVDFWLKMLAINIPDPRIADLIFWPGEYLGDGDNLRQLTPEQILDIAQAAGRGSSLTE